MFQEFGFEIDYDITAKEVILRQAKIYRTRKATSQQEKETIKQERKIRRKKSKNRKTITGERNCKAGKINTGERN